VLFGIAALALAGLPPFATAVGKSMAESASVDAALGWVPVVLIATSALTAAAVLRAGGRVFLGLGTVPEGIEAEGMSGDSELIEVPVGAEHTPFSMLAPSVALIVAGLALGLVPGLADVATRAAARFVDGAGYAAAALSGRTAYAYVALPPVEVWSARDLTLAAISVVAAAAVALLAIGSSGVRSARAGRLRDAATALVRAPLDGLRRLHSGHVGDYVVWLVLGIAVMAFGLLGIELT
jgi:multicomponent Na+:H+ antiporter subunit D